jgi:ArsR family transcriptional regulator
MDTKSLVKLAKSLSDPTRLRMLQEIARAQRLGCANLYEFVPISQPSMSQHVKALVDAGLVNSCKEGRNMYLTINTEKLQELESFLQLLKMSELPDSKPLLNNASPGQAQGGPHRGNDKPLNP